MQAAVFEAPYELTMKDRERPVPKQGEALVKVDAAGLCAGVNGFTKLHHAG